MERLTKTYSDGTHGASDSLPCGENSYNYKNLLIEKLGKYEDLEEQGRLIKLPCKIGDKVWHISGRDIKEDVISGIEYSYDGMFYIWSNEDTWLGGFNDIVFLTKSEAEAKLKKLIGGENE